MMRTLLFTFLAVCYTFSLRAESTERWLVELKSSDTQCLEDWWVNNGWNDSEYIKKALPLDNWWVLEIPTNHRESLESLQCVQRVTADQRIDWRDTQPNDPAYINQGDMNLIGMTKAWDVSTGGVTAQGDTIVVAIIDAGYQIDHEDLVGNIWVNKGEIPGDGIDNDDNGYIDDYRGLNINSGDDQHPINSHGTSVSGIIGARGNNSKGVAGINWRVKLMLVSGADFESKIIEGYQYILDMRKKYRQTNGADGAFIVATNLSGGVNFALAQDHPLWCEMYDKLGAEGILSVCAAPNNGISVDVDGDMPTTCSSPYMIAVTNVDLTDELLSNAGYGATSIDIGAPGHGTITIASGNQYKEFPGTSSATPHVTGAVALMYSTPCSSFLGDLQNDPSAMAEKVRNLIFATAKSNNSLKEITVTGKRLQVDAALKATTIDCGPVVTSGVQILYIHPNLVHLEDIQAFFEVKGDTSTAYFELYNATGARVYHYPITDAEFGQKYLTIDASPLAAGVYFLTLRNKKEKSTRKFVVY